MAVRVFDVLNLMREKRLSTVSARFGLFSYPIMYLSLRPFGNVKSSSARPVLLCCKQSSAATGLPYAAFCNRTKAWLRDR